MFYQSLYSPSAGSIKSHIANLQCALNQMVPSSFLNVQISALEDPHLVSQEYRFWFITKRILFSKEKTSVVSILGWVQEAFPSDIRARFMMYLREVLAEAKCCLQADQAAHSSAAVQIPKETSRLLSQRGLFSLSSCPAATQDELQDDVSPETWVRAAS